MACLQRKFQIRVERAVAKRAAIEKMKLTNVPPVLLNLLVVKNVQLGLHEFGLSTSRIVISVFTFAVSMVVVYVFLFIGFNAFTDPNDIISGIVNSSIAVTVAFCAQYACAMEDSPELVKESVHQTNEQVMRSLHKVFEMLTTQLDLAMRVFKKMKNDRFADAAKGEGSHVSSDDSHSDRS